LRQNINSISTDDRQNNKQGLPKKSAGSMKITIKRNIVEKKIIDRLNYVREMMDNVEHV
jgi:hypothetical protein